jgi:hypothetical protein
MGPLYAHVRGNLDTIGTIGIGDYGSSDENNRVARWYIFLPKI